MTIVLAESFDVSQARVLPTYKFKPERVPHTFIEMRRPLHNGRKNNRMLRVADFMPLNSDHDVRQA